MTRCLKWRIAGTGSILRTLRTSTVEGSSARVSVLVFGLNYRTAPVGLLERLSVSSEQLSKAVTSLTGREHVSEAVVLSTCNRVEVYAAVGRYHGAMADIRNFFSEWGGVAPEDFSSLAYDYFDDRAAAHLFQVTAGLDSMVVGERQIHLQVRQAFKDAQAHGSSGRMLSALFRRALNIAKRARAETEISNGRASMVDAGLEAAGRVLGDVEGRSVLILGAGKMGGMAGSRLASLAGSLTVTNRSHERAERLAERVGADALSITDLVHGLRGADLVITSTAATDPVIDYDDVDAVMASRGGRPLVLLDLAVPRNVDPSCAGIPGVTVLDVDGIRELSDAGAVGTSVEQARVMVEEAAAEFAAWTRTVAAEPTITALRKRAERIRAEEVERCTGRLADLDDRERAAVEALSKSIVSTLLHEPTVRLKQIADQRGGELHANALRELFDLDEPPES